MTHDTKFHFLTMTEGWTATTADSHVIADFRKAHRTYANTPNSRLKGSIAPKMGGCLRTTLMNTTVTTNNVWELTTTWAALGVPAGQTVNSVTADYQFRFDFGRAVFNVNSISANTNKSGPLELRDGSGNLVGAISTAQTLPTTGHGGGNTFEQHWPYTPNDQMTGTRSSDTNHHWATVTGTPVIVPSGMSASSSTVKLRLNNQLQAVARNGWSYMRLRQDRIAVTVTYGTASVTTRRVFII